jgi:lectin, mannose-binding 1
LLQVHVPAHYHFGLTAATNDNPDEIEVHSLIIQSPVHHDYHHDDHHDGHHDHHDQPPQHSYYKEHHDIHDSRDPYHDKDWYWGEEKDRQRDRSADEYKSESSRFADLHDRVQYLTHQLDMVFHDISVMKEIHEERHKELISWLSPVHDYAEAAKLTLDRMEVVVDAIRSDVETKEFKQHLEDLATLIGHSHTSLLEHLPNAMHNGRSSIRGPCKLMLSVVQTNSPRFGFFVFIIVASQVMLLGSYIVYRRRRDMAPKKFL